MSNFQAFLRTFSNGISRRYSTQFIILNFYKYLKSIKNIFKIFSYIEIHDIIIIW